MTTRIAGIVLDDNKQTPYALTKIYGIGKILALKICKQAQVNIKSKLGEIPDVEKERIREIIEKNYRVEGQLRLQVSQNIKRLKDISSYRGSRHLKNLPVRGQRTKTNARTKRGKKVTVGTSRRKSVEKT